MCYPKRSLTLKTVLAAAKWIIELSDNDLMASSTPNDASVVCESCECVHVLVMCVMCVHVRRIM